MSKDADRPDKFKSHAPLDKVMTKCTNCVNNKHSKCNWTAANGKVRCLCDWYGHPKD